MQQADLEKQIADIETQLSILNVQNEKMLSILTQGPSRSSTQIQYTLKSAFSNTIGCRASNEDEYLNELQLYGIFDGHNGVDSAYQIKCDLLSKLQLYKSLPPKVALQLAIHEIDKEICEDQFINKSGSTLAVCWFIDNILLVAVVGDAQVLIKTSQQVVLTNAQKPSDDEEQIRISQCGGNCQLINGVWRVNKQLATSRAIGDAEYKLFGVSSQPEIYEFNATDVKYCIIGCDGVWDVLNDVNIINFLNESSNESVEQVFLNDELKGKQLLEQLQCKQLGWAKCDNIQSTGDLELQRIVSSIVKFAYFSGSKDNITVGLIKVI